jgi:hypothetical protein
MVSEIRYRFRFEVTARSINNITCKLKFKYQPPRHVQLLTERFIRQRIAFYNKYLGFPFLLPLVHLSVKFSIVLGDEKLRIYSRRGENYPSANVSAANLPPSLMVFAVP